jgi:hypothetical protein
MYVISVILMDYTPSGTANSFSNGSARPLAANREPMRKLRTGAMFTTGTIDLSGSNDLP